VDCKTRVRVEPIEVESLPDEPPKKTFQSKLKHFLTKKDQDIQQMLSQHKPEEEAKEEPTPLNTEDHNLK
jgi:hypothetical protein